MKHLKAFILLPFIAGVIAISCQSNSDKTTTTASTDVETVSEAGKGKIEFEDAFFDFKELTPGEVVSHTYKFKNVGTESLTIQNVKPSCGCTSPKYTKAPVVPGATGEIEIQFNSKGKKGKQSKSATVITNGTPKEVKLRFAAEIKDEE